VKLPANCRWWAAGGSGRGSGLAAATAT